MHAQVVPCFKVSLTRETLPRLNRKDITTIILGWKRGFLKAKFWLAKDTERIMYEVPTATFLRWFPEQAQRTDSSCTASNFVSLNEFAEIVSERSSGRRSSRFHVSLWVRMRCADSICRKLHLYLEIRSTRAEDAIHFLHMHGVQCTLYIHIPLSAPAVLGTVLVMLVPGREISSIAG